VPLTVGGYLLGSTLGSSGHSFESPAHSAKTMALNGVFLASWCPSFVCFLLFSVRVGRIWSHGAPAHPARDPMLSTGSLNSPASAGDMLRCCASFRAGVLQTSTNLRNPGQNEIWGWQTMGGKRRVRRIEYASCEAKRHLTCPHRLPGSSFGGLLFVSAAGLTRGTRKVICLDRGRYGPWYRVLPLRPLWLT